MVKRLPPLVGLAWLLACAPLMAQDPHFSMFFANPVHLNAAYAGLSPGTSVTLNHHEQWQGIPDGQVDVSPIGYRTVQATADRQLPCLLPSCKVRLGVAGSVFHDAAGAVPLKTFGAGLATSFAYRFQCSPFDYTELRLGWQTSWMQRSLSNDHRIYSSQLDPYYGLIGDPNVIGLDARFLNHNVGFMARFVRNIYNHWTLGLGVANLLEPNQSLFDAPASDPLPRRYTLHAGGTRKMGEVLYFSPQFRWDIQAKGQLHLMTGGAYLQSNKFYTGLFLQGNWRNYSSPAVKLSDARLNPGIMNLSMTAGIDFVKLTRQLDAWDQKGRQMIIGLTYDLSLSSMSNRATWGGLELNIRMNFSGDPSKRCKDNKDGGSRPSPGQVRKCPVLERS